MCLCVFSLYNPKLQEQLKILIALGRAGHQVDHALEAVVVEFKDIPDLKQDMRVMVEPAQDQV